MKVSAAPPVENFETEKRALEERLYKTVQDQIARIFAEKNFDIRANQKYVVDGLKTAQGIISNFAGSALVEKREQELEDTMGRVTQTVAIHIMSTARILNEMTAVEKNVTSSAEEVEKQKHLQQERGQKILQLQQKSARQLSSILSGFFDGSAFVDDSAIRRKDDMVRRLTKAHHTGEASQVKQVIAERTASMDMMRKYLAIAEKKGCTPDKVTAKDLAAFERDEQQKQELIRRRHEEKLLALDSQPKRLKKKGLSSAKTDAKVISIASEAISSKKNPASKVPTKQTPQMDAPQKGSAAPPKQPPNPTYPKASHAIDQQKKAKGRSKEEILQGRVEFIFHLQKKSMIETARIRRWKTKNPTIIREFKDRNKQGKIVQKYANLTDKEISVQRAFHYLPGTEKLLSEDYREIYTFPTEKGRGAYASHFLNGIELTGFVYFGQDKRDGKIYHKNFEPKRYEAKDFISLFNEHEEIDMEEEEGGEWETQAVYQLEIDSRGILTAKFTDEDHSIQIYPIRNELLPKEIFNHE